MSRPGSRVEHGETAPMFEDPVHDETARYIAGGFG
jgi:ABC-type phosphate transport system ATPase subunit